MANDAVLSLSDVTVRYGATVAVNALCLEVAAGEIFGLLGPNGSGKSTTLSAIAGSLPLDTGSICVAGLQVSEQPLAYRRRLGLVPQELAFYEDLSGTANLHFFGRLYGLSGRDLRRRVDEALAMVRLTADAGRPARTYSGGMQRRLNLACALLHRPTLLLLDEPTVGLDLDSRDSVFASLRDLRRQGTALVFTTHHLEEVELLCDRIGVMDRGRPIALGTLPELAALTVDATLRVARLATLRVASTIRPTSNLEAVFRGLTGRSLCQP
jgi:ABC-2 type transport system ATP-binding protein